MSKSESLQGNGSLPHMTLEVIVDEITKRNITIGGIPSEIPFQLHPQLNQIFGHQLGRHSVLNAPGKNYYIAEVGILTGQGLFESTVESPSPYDAVVLAYLEALNLALHYGV